jgi:hypothetical protein
MNVIIARSEATRQSHEIASLRPEHHLVQGFVRNDNLQGGSFVFRTFVLVSNFACLPVGRDFVLRIYVLMYFFTASNPLQRWASSWGSRV